MCKKLYPSNCTSGQVTKDNCGCCEECAKAEGQSCEGELHLYSGRCADGLTCFKQPETQSLDQGFLITTGLGTCCCPKKTLVETGEVFLLDDSTDAKALDICKNKCVYRKEGATNGNAFCFKEVPKGGFQVGCTY